VQEVVAAIRAEIGDEHLFMAEVTAPIERLVRYYGADGEGAHLPFNFHLIGVEWTPAAIADLSSATRPRCPRARGRTGCSATTTSRAWRAGSARARRAPPRCCC
jgi:hypothetical protein